METFRQQTQNRRTAVVVLAVTLIGYVVWVATYSPTALDRLRGEDYYGASACQNEADWLDEAHEDAPAYRLHTVGFESSLATTPAIKGTSGLIGKDDRFAAYRGAVAQTLKTYGWGAGYDFADDLEGLDAACRAQGIDMPPYHPLV